MESNIEKVTRESLIEAMVLMMFLDFIRSKQEPKDVLDFMLDETKKQLIDSLTSGAADYEKMLSEHPKMKNILDIWRWSYR